MRIEIFVVLSKMTSNWTNSTKETQLEQLKTQIISIDNVLEALLIIAETQLEQLKTQIIREFGGLTETGIEQGYCLEYGNICVDSVKRWIIYTQKRNAVPTIEAIAKQIKIVTSQESQAFGIDGKLYLV